MKPSDKYKSEGFFCVKRSYKICLTPKDSCIKLNPELNILKEKNMCNFIQNINIIIIP